MRLLPSGPCVHPDSISGVQGSEGREGGRADPAQAVLTLDRATDSIPRVLPPFPPHPDSGGGGAAVTRACAGEGFGSAQNGHQQ